jgi:iron complex outermembrane receptor protein
MKFYIHLTLFLILNLSLLAQEKNIVLDSNKKGIENVEIYLPDYDLILYSDSKGEFSLPQNQDIYLIASKEGFKTISTVAKQTKETKLTLEKLHVELDEIIVSTINHKLSSNQTLSISSKKINSINKNSSNFVQALESISGIDKLSTGTGVNKVVVRGLSGTRVVTYINGVRIENQQWGGDHGIGFTSLGFSKVEIMKGPSSIMFGADALGGVLYFVDEPFERNEKLTINYNSLFESTNLYFNNQLSTKWSSGNFKVNAYAEYGKASDYKLPQGKYLYNSRFENKAVKVIVGYSKKRWLINAKYQLNDNYAGVPGHSHEAVPTIDDLTSNNTFRHKSRPAQFVTNQIANIENTFLLPNSKLKLDLSYTLNQLREYEAWTVPEIDLDLSTNQWNFRWHKNIKDKINLTIGTQGSRQYNRNQPARTQILEDANLFDIGYYGLIDYESKIINFSVASRIDRRKIETIETPSFSKTYDGNSISLGLNKSIKNHTLRINYSSGLRTPHLTELLADGVHHGTNRFERGNPDLKIEKGQQLDFNYEWANEHLGFIVNPFIHKIDNFINLTPTGETINDYPVYEYQQVDFANLQGAEINLHYHPHFLHQLHFEQSYSFIEGTSNNDSALALIPSNKVYSEVSYSLKNAKIIKKIIASQSYHFSKEDVAFNEQTSKSYQLIDLFLEWKHKNRLSGNLGVRNILNTEYLPHLSSLKRFDVFNPGRSFYFKINVEI